MPRSVRSRRPDSPLVSPENRRNVIPFERNVFANELTAVLGGHDLTVALDVEHDTDSRTGNRYVMYKVPKQIGDVLHDRFLFQDTNEFDMNWFYESIRYTKNLGIFDTFTLKSYTKYGDEIVNNYLRDPAGFRTNARVNDLLFNIMPRNQHLCFAIQLILYHFYGNSHINDIVNNFITNNGELISLEFNDLREIWNEYEQREDWDAIYQIIEGYIGDLQRIINDAPKPTRPMRVFRGAKRDYLRDSVNTAVHSRGFTSTTMNPDTVFRFKGRNNVFEMIINPNVSCVVTEDLTYFRHEYEILINSDTLVKPSEKKEKFTLNEDEGYGYYDVDHVFDPQREAPSLYSRRVAVYNDAPAVAVGGKMRSKNLRSKMTRSSKSKKMQQSTTRSKTRKNRTKNSNDEAYARPNLDPVLVRGPPIPKEVDDYLDSLLKQFR
jgi:hypothetical protein